MCTLLLDSHYGERPEEVADRLAASDFSPKPRRQLTRALKRVGPYRPWPWPCRSACGAGALELALTPRQNGDWLRAHRAEVVAPRPSAV
ncbi:hypothetical protein ACPCSQ_14540 [Streptomyces griseoincarnatus]|uniref:hypothetical protein n=1 Tax=Streptomyces sp. SMS_SU21 TaxID=2069440 RepID=UPI000C886F3A|nr:hypothetical protein [Streptomyces sp. SMS_SU21]MCA2201989.1 hypothetical protein [Streptomyces sp. SMS_SU21]NEA91689.1 hypothetical protein [Actinospica acidiphila]